MNEILNKFYKKITGKDILRTPPPQGVTRSQDAREQLGYLVKERHDEMERQRIAQEKEIKREEEKLKKEGRKEAIKRKLGMITTNDLEEKFIPGKGFQFKLKPGYLERRKQKKRAKNESEGPSFSRGDWR